MSEYIPLQTITPSSSEESVFNRPSTSGVRRRGGYTSIPIHSSTSTISSVGSESKFKAPRVGGVIGATVGAGSQYQGIFEGQLGAAAADPNNPFVQWLNKEPDPQKIKYEQESEELLRRNRISAGYKPYEVPWNKNSKSQWREHWKLVNPRSGQKKVQAKQQQVNRDSAVLSRGEPQRNGLVLPFSNNIGPGNPIRPPTNRADLIAQGHDIHYQQAKKDSDVLSADREAISQFAHEAIQGSDPISRLHATVGGLGLGIKHGVEKLTGKVLYGEL
nr:MAG: structural protein [Canine parvovirus]